MAAGRSKFIRRQYTLPILANDKPLTGHATAAHSVVPHAMQWPLAAIAGLLLAVAGQGPDFGHYTDWAAAALSGDIFTLRGNVLSPGGVPFTIAAAGPGLLFALGKAVFVPVSLGTAALVTGWLAALVFWWCALVVLRRLSSDNGWLALFGAAALFVGTHAGLYSHVYATEVFANALIAALWALALTRERGRLLDCAAVGALSGLLLLVRAHVVLYAVPALWLAVIGGMKPAGAMPVSWRKVAARLMVTAVPLVIALGEYVLVNRWMTGSLLHPPYLYGGAGFSSVDLRHPQVAAVLVHPWHGLLSYHPLYGVAFCALAFMAWRAVPLRPLWIATLLAVMAHVWVQAGWYIWWLGGSTFGMRGMAPAALPLVAGLIAAITHEADRRPGRVSAWLCATAVACAWSYPLLLRGYTGFYTWRPLIAEQRSALLAIAAVLTFFGYLVVSRRVATGADGLGVRVGAIAGIAAAAVYLAWQLSMFPAPAMRVVLAAVAAAAVLLASQGWRPDSRNHSRFARHLPRVALAVTVIVFAVQAVLFTRLAVRTERLLASAAPPPRQFDYVGASPVDELRVTYAEYLDAPGFESQKHAFRRFLAWQRIAVSPMAPQDRQIADAVRQLLDAEPAFGDVLIETTARDGVVQIAGSGLSDAQQSRARRLALSVPGVQSVTFSAN